MPFKPGRIRHNTEPTSGNYGASSKASHAWLEGGSFAPREALKQNTSPPTSKVIGDALGAIYPPSSRFQCSECGFVAVTKSGLSRHTGSRKCQSNLSQSLSQSQMLPEFNSPPGGLKSPKPKCSRIVVHAIPSKGLIRYTTGKQQICPLCAQVFTTRTKLVQHMRSTHYMGKFLSQSKQVRKFIRTIPRKKGSKHPPKPQKVLEEPDWTDDDVLMQSESIIHSLCDSVPGIVEERDAILDFHRKVSGSQCVPLS